MPFVFFNSPSGVSWVCHLLLWFHSRKGCTRLGAGIADGGNRVAHEYYWPGSGWEDPVQKVRVWLDTETSKKIRETSRGRFFADTFWCRSLMLKKVLLCGTWKVICNVVRWSFPRWRNCCFFEVVSHRLRQYALNFANVKTAGGKTSGVFFRWSWNMRFV